MLFLSTICNHKTISQIICCDQHCQGILWQAIELIGTLCRLEWHFSNLIRHVPTKLWFNWMVHFHTIGQFWLLKCCQCHAKYVTCTNKYNWAFFLAVKWIVGWFCFVVSSFRPFLRLSVFQIYLNLFAQKWNFGFKQHHLTHLLYPMVLWLVSPKNQKLFHSTRLCPLYFVGEKPCFASSYCCQKLL